MKSYKIGKKMMMEEMERKGRKVLNTRWVIIKNMKQNTKYCKARVVVRDLKKRNR